MERDEAAMARKSGTAVVARGGPAGKHAHKTVRGRPGI
jgi:hypothetical protein